MDDEVGSLVEKLKPQFVTKWLKTVCDVRFDVMVMCLLPKPVEFARVRQPPVRQEGNTNSVVKAPAYMLSKQPGGDLWQRPSKLLEED